MKDSKTIISHLKKHPSMKILNQEECYNILISLLPKSLTKFIKFLYIKHNILFFVVKHPAIKVEFDYKLDLIKSLLKKLVTVHPNCKCIDLDNIQVFVSNKKDEVETIIPESKIYFIERSNGEFVNSVKDEKLFELFEEIKKEIKKNKDD